MDSLYLRSHHRVCVLWYYVPLNGTWYYVPYIQLLFYELTILVVTTERLDFVP